jgi:hypothetical protein
MEVIKDVEFEFVGMGRPTQYNGQGRRRYSLAFSFKDKAMKKQLEDQYGFNVKAEEDENNGGIKYKARIYSNAFKAQEGSSGQVDDLEQELRAPTIQLANGAEVDPDTVGAGSRGHIAFDTYQTAKMEKPGRSLRKVSVTKWVKRAAEEDPFEGMEDDVEIVGGDSADGPGDTSGGQAQDDLY